MDTLNAVAKFEACLKEAGFELSESRIVYMASKDREWKEGDSVLYKFRLFGETEWVSITGTPTNPLQERLEAWLK